MRFLPSHSGHNAASVAGLLPTGAEPFKSKLNQPFEHTFRVPGVYGIQCIPHVAMGMVMVIQVGDAPTAELPASLPARAKARFAAQLQNSGPGSEAAIRAAHTLAGSAPLHSNGFTEDGNWNLINRRAFDPVTQGAIFIANRHVPTGQRNRNCMCVVCHTGSCSTSTTVKPCRSQNAMAPGRNG